MTATAEQTETVRITEPGLYPGLDFATYLADPYIGGSLSHSGAKTILKTPARFAWEREHGRPPSDSFDLGHAAHLTVLGEGLPVEVIPEDLCDKNGGWTTAKARARVAELREAGITPVKPETWQTVQDMAAALRRHPIASRLFAPGTGRPEVSAFAPDDETGVMMRCRFDWLTDQPSSRGRLLIGDYKTCESADDTAFGKAAANCGYDVQDAFYSAIARRLKLAPDVAYLFVAQEKTPPYLVNVIQLDHTAARIGEIKMRRALATYKHCTETGDWPGYPPKVALVSLPIWEQRLYEQDLIV